MPSRFVMSCRVCGLLQQTPPWGPAGNKPSFNICPCCGTEFGYDDATLAGVMRKRAIWRDEGAEWFIPAEKPANWSLTEQMQNIPSDYVDGSA